MPSMRTCADPATLSAGATVSRSPGTPATSPATSRSRSVADAHDLGWRARRRSPPAPRRGRRCRRRCGCRCAARAPGRRRRSADRATTPSRTASTPTPFGPAELVGAQRQQVDVRPQRRAGRARTAACTASVWSSASGARRATSGAHGGEVGDRADLVVDGHHADDRARRRRARASSASRSTRPAASTATTVPPTRSTACSTAWCSVAGHTARPPRRATAPAIAALSASVPHPVNTTSPGRQPMTRGDDVARLVDGPPGVAGEAVRAARVGEALGEERQHRRDGVLAHRRRRRVVEVDQPVHGRPR